MRIAPEDKKEEGDGQSSWQRRLGGAALAQAVVAASTSSSEGDRGSKRWVSPSKGEAGSEAIASLVAAACSLLRDAEPRVRHAAAGLLGALAAASSSSSSESDESAPASASSASASSSSSSFTFPPVWLQGARDAIFDIVERDWDRDEQERGGEGEEGKEKEKEKGKARDGGPIATADGGDGLSSPSSPPSPPSPPQPSSLVDAALSAAYARQRPGKGELRHGSEGWRCLETALVALLSIVDGAGASFAPVARRCPEVRALVLRSLLHPNRFVREAGYGTLGGLCALAGSVGELDKWGARDEDGGGNADADAAAAPSASSSFADAAALALVDGLSENWSQVRLSACVAARSLLAAAAAHDEATSRGGKGGSEESELASSSSSSSLHSRVLARLLPQLAFNRYDAAEGVRAYSNGTWLLHTRGKGRDWVTARSAEVFDYYLKCSRANNHMVRESAAVCVGELFSKVGRGGEGGGGAAPGKAADDYEGKTNPSSPSRSVRSLVPRALQLLLSSARDDAWPVRDEGGRALAGLLAAFPEEVLCSSTSSAAAAGGGGGAAASKDPCSSTALVDSLVSIWKGNLEDNVPSVRDGAAVSMADALEGLLKRAREEEKEEEGIASSAARRLSSAIEETIKERLPRAAQQPPGECAGAPNAVPFRIQQQQQQQQQQAPTAAPGRALGPFLDSSRASPAATADADASGDAALFAPSDLLLRRRRRDTGGVDFSCGCMDYGFRRPLEPWEQADGAARLLREWSRVEAEKALTFAEVLADASAARHFAAAPALRETVWSSLPLIARNVGIRAFKGRMLEHFLGPLVGCLEAGVGLGGGGEAGRTGGGGSSLGGESTRSVAAAGAALGALRDLMGPRIFAGRLDKRQRRVVEASAEVPPPAGAFAPRVGGVGGGGGGGSLLRGAGVGAFFGGATTARTLPPAPFSPSPPFSLPLGAGARPEGYCPGGMPLRK